MSLCPVVLPLPKPKTAAPSDLSRLLKGFTEHERTQNPACRPANLASLQHNGDHATTTEPRGRVSVGSKEVSEVNFTFSLFKTNADLKHIPEAFFFLKA